MLTQGDRKKRRRALKQKSSTERANLPFTILLPVAQANLFHGIPQEEIQSGREKKANRKQIFTPETPEGGYCQNFVARIPLVDRIMDPHPGVVRVKMRVGLESEIWVQYLHSSVSQQDTIKTELIAQCISHRLHIRVTTHFHHFFKKG